MNNELTLRSQSLFSQRKHHERIIVFLGENEVGKTSILNSLSKRKFPSNYQETLGVDFYSKEFVLSSMHKVTLALWDTNGKEKKTITLAPSLYKNASTFAIVISYDKRKSLETLQEYIQLALRFHPGKFPHIVVIVNKEDIQNKQFKIGEVAKIIYDYSQSIDICELSAKNFEKVNCVFFDLSKQLLGFKKRRMSGKSFKSGSSNSKATTEIGDGGDSAFISVKKSFKIDEDVKTEGRLLNKSEIEDKKKKCC